MCLVAVADMLSKYQGGETGPRFNSRDGNEHAPVVASRNGAASVCA